MLLTTCPLTNADTVVLQHLLADAMAPATTNNPTAKRDNGTYQLLADLNSPSRPQFEPTVFTTWDLKNLHVPIFMRDYILHPYITWAQTIVRHPTDVVFLTHIIFYLSTLAPSTLYLFYRFSLPHALLHWLLETYSCGPFTLMMHNHIHNDGLLDHRYPWLDMLIPYTLGPLMGHTWNSYYYHHVKHHHVENNGPDDLSSTIRYQRDSLPDFLGYLCRFLFLVWIELPVYFLRRRRYNMASMSFVSEISSIYLIFYLSQYNFHATMVTMMLPLIQTRVGMMVGNWGQHAFIERNEPTCNYRSSITLIDVQVCYGHRLR